MRKLNQKGQVALFFVLLVPFMVLLLVTTVRFSELIFTKMKLQGALDRGIYAGASYLADVLNQQALFNEKAYRLFADAKEDFLRRGSKRTEKEAKEQVQKLWADQEKLYDQMEALSEKAYTEAYAIAEGEVQRDFPKLALQPLYHGPFVFKDGPREIFPFDKIKGSIIFDPTGHQKIPKADYEARMAFVKDPASVVALAASARTAQGVEAVAAAEPFSGSLWNFATLSQEKFLYQTAMVPLETLPANGLVEAYDVHH